MLYIVTANFTVSSTAIIACQNNKLGQTVIKVILVSHESIASVETNEK